MTNKPARGFPTEEFEARLSKAQSLMSERNLDAILLTTEHDIHYFTGFFTQFWQSPTRPWFVILPITGYPIAVIPEIGVPSMNNGFVKDIRSWSSPHPTDDGVSLLIDALRECCGTAKSNIGINMGQETFVRMPMTDFKLVEENLTQSGTTFVDATDIMRGLRMVKSPAEILKLRYVAQSVSGVFETLYDFVSVGMRDDEVFKAFKIACLDAGLDDVSYLVGAAGFQGYSDVISPPKGRPLGEGDVLILDTGCTFDGYYCDFDRNYGFGNVDDLSKRAYEIVWQASEAGIAMAKPGNRCCDLFHAMNDVMKKGGAQGDSVGRYGHGLGLQLTEPPSHTSWNETVLETGMVLTIEPGMLYGDGKVMLHEENLVITENGCELLSRRAPAEMPVLK